MSNVESAVQAPVIRQVFMAPDGTYHSSKAEVMDHLRKPQVLAALNKLTEANNELSTWLQDNQDEIESAFETGTVKRVSKKERKELQKAADAVAEMFAADPVANSALKFLAENADQAVDSFRWPTVKRMNDEEKALAAKNTLLALSEGNDQLVDWVIASKDALLEAYTAGIVKRAVSAKATAGLDAYRAEKALEKAAKEAGTEAFAAYQKDKAERNAAKAEAEKG